MQRPTLQSLWEAEQARIALEKKQYAEAMRELHGADDWDYSDDIRQDAEMEAVGDMREAM